MQINFFTSPTDEEQIIDFIEKKGGYFISNFWKPKSDSIKVLHKGDISNIAELRDIGILSNEILPITSNSIKVSDLRDDRGFPIVEIIEFTRSYSKGDKFYPGRLWINGLKPETERLYKSISGFIRRNFTNENGWYAGKTANEYCSSNNLQKASSTHL